MGDVSLVELMDSQSLAKLTGFIPEQDVPQTDSTQERGTGKSKIYREILNGDPGLRNEIIHTFKELSERKIPMPVIHITTPNVLTDDGITSTGFIDNIEKNGFRAKDTNVAAFMERGSTLHLASPEYFAENPQMFLRGLADILQRYKHHGIRTNKDSLGDGRDQGVGLPTMLIIDSRGVQLMKGTDYDDHFILYNHVPSTNILGSVDIKEADPRNVMSLKKVARDVLGVVTNR